MVEGRKGERWRRYVPEEAETLLSFDVICCEASMYAADFLFFLFVFLPLWLFKVRAVIR